MHTNKGENFESRLDQKHDLSQWLKTAVLAALEKGYTIDVISCILQISPQEINEIITENKPLDPFKEGIDK